MFLRRRQRPEDDWDGCPGGDPGSEGGRGSQVVGCLVCLETDSAPDLEITSLRAPSRGGGVKVTNATTKYPTFTNVAVVEDVEGTYKKNTSRPAGLRKHSPWVPVGSPVNPGNPDVDVQLLHVSHN